MGFLSQLLLDNLSFPHPLDGPDPGTTTPVLNSNIVVAAPRIPTALNVAFPPSRTSSSSSVAHLLGQHTAPPHRKTSRQRTSFFPCGSSPPNASGTSLLACGLGAGFEESSSCGDGFCTGGFADDDVCAKVGKKWTCITLDSYFLKGGPLVQVDCDRSTNKNIPTCTLPEPDMQKRTWLLFIASFLLSAGGILFLNEGERLRVWFFGELRWIRQRLGMRHSEFKEEKEEREAREAAEKERKKAEKETAEREKQKTKFLKMWENSDPSGKGDEEFDKMLSLAAEKDPQLEQEVRAEIAEREEKGKKKGKKGKEKGGKGDEAEAPPKTEEQKQAEEDPFGTLQAARQAKLDDEERMRKETEASEKQQADLLASARGMTSTMKGGKKGGKGGSNAMVKGRNLK